MNYLRCSNWIYRIFHWSTNDWTIRWKSSNISTRSRCMRWGICISGHQRRFNSLSKRVFDILLMLMLVTRSLSSLREHSTRLIFYYHMFSLLRISLSLLRIEIISSWCLSSCIDSLRSGCLRPSSSSCLWSLSWSTLRIVHLWLLGNHKTSCLI